MLLLHSNRRNRQGDGVDGDEAGAAVVGGRICFLCLGLLLLGLLMGVIMVVVVGMVVGMVVGVVRIRGG